MRLVVVCALSFFFTLVIAAIIFPSPPAKPKSSGRHGAVQTTTVVANPFDFLPSTPSSLSLVTSSSQPYEVAKQLIMKGRLRDAQDQYLQILVARSPIDQKALLGLARVQGLLTHGDPATLQRQADVYRQTIAQGTTGGPYRPRELELLAEASLLAAQQIQAEQAPVPTAVGSRAPIVSGIPQNSLQGSATPAHVSAVPAPSATVQQVVRLGSALNPGSTGSEISPVEKPASSGPSSVIPIPVSSTPPGSGSLGTSGSDAGGGSGWWILG